MLTTDVNLARLTSLSWLESGLCPRCGCEDEDCPVCGGGAIRPENLGDRLDFWRQQGRPVLIAGETYCGGGHCHSDSTLPLSRQPAEAGCCRHA
jgi:hypothetical protein